MSNYLASNLIFRWYTGYHVSFSKTETENNILTGYHISFVHKFIQGSDRTEIALDMNKFLLFY